MTARVIAGADADVAVDVVDAGGAVFARRRCAFVHFDLAEPSHETGTAFANELLRILRQRGFRTEEGVMGQNKRFWRCLINLT